MFDKDDWFGFILESLGELIESMGRLYNKGSWVFIGIVIASIGCFIWLT